MPKSSPKTLICIGSNQKSVFGNVRETVQKAMSMVANLSDGGVSCSHFYQTPAFPPGSGPDFVNAAIAITTGQPAAAILRQLHDIEDQADRIRTARWEQRTLDLDLIGMGDQIQPDIESYINWRDLPFADQMEKSPDELILPHPRLQDRAFALVPLADVAPDWVHPVLGQTITDLRDACPPHDLAAVTRLT